MNDKMKRAEQMAARLPPHAQQQARRWVRRLQQPSIVRGEKEARDAYAQALGAQMDAILRRQAYSFTGPFQRAPSAAPLSQQWIADFGRANQLQVAAGSLRDSISALDSQQREDLELARSISSDVDYISEKGRIVDEKMYAVQKNDWDMLRELEKSVNACRTRVGLEDLNYMQFGEGSTEFIEQRQQQLESSQRLVEELIESQETSIGVLENREVDQFAYNSIRMIQEIREETSLLRSRATEQRRMIEALIETLTTPEQEPVEIDNVQPEEEYDVYQE